MKSILIIAFVLNFLTMPNSLAGTRPLVEIKFELKEPTFRRSFLNDVNPATGLTELQEFELKVSRQLETVFAAKIGFLDFRAGSNAYQLSITIEPEARINTELLNTSFNLELKDPLSQPLGTAKWLFRTSSEYTLSVVPSDFSVEVANRMALRLEEHMVDAIASLFSHIPVSKEIYLFVGPQTLCILPFTFEELKIGLNSGLEIESPPAEDDLVDMPRYHGLRAVRLKRALNGVPTTYAQGIGGIEDAGVLRKDRTGGHTHFNKLGASNGPVNALGVYVTDYVPLIRAEPTVTSPSGFSVQ